MDQVSRMRSECDFGGRLMKMLGDPKFIFKVAELDGLVVGFVVYGNGKRRIRVKEIAVDQGFRGLGVASSMLGSLTAMNPNPKELEAVVPEHNLAAQMLFKKSGFVAVETVAGGNAYKFVRDSAKG